MNIILNAAKIEDLRKELLGILGSIKRVHDYDSAKTLRRTFKTWAWRLEDLILKEIIPAFQEEIKDRKSLKNTADFHEKALRKEIQALVAENIPLYNVDDKNNKEDQYSYYLEEIKRSEARIKKAAREVWKVMIDFIEWYESQNRGKSIELKFSDEESIDIEGFPVTFVGLSDMKDAKSYYDIFAEALKRYRQRASSVLPELLRRQLPLFVSFYKQKNSGFGLYMVDSISINGWALASLGVNESVKTLAHEMGHHLWVSLSKTETDFWEKMFSGDLGNLDLRQVVKDYGPKVGWIDNSSPIKDKDPFLYYQLYGMDYNPHSPKGLKGVYNVGALEKYLQGGGEPVLKVLIHPPSGYASKSPEEAFCEVIGSLVAYGPMTVDPMVRSWIKELFPSIKIAMIANRVVKSLLNVVGVGKKETMR